MSVSQPRPFRGSRWFKGNLHAHTELSDGALSPARVVEIYKKHNYDFLAVTDHDLYDACPELSDEDFLILPSGEFAINNLRGERTPQRPEHSFDIVFYLKDPDFPNRLPAGYRFRDPRGSEGLPMRPAISASSRTRPAAVTLRSRRRMRPCSAPLRSITTPPR